MRAMGWILNHRCRRGIHRRSEGLLLAALAVCMSCFAASHPAAASELETESLLRIEWLGTRKLAENTNATTPLRILSMPESVALEKQTLDKLSRAPWVLLDREIDTNASLTLRPLLDDLVAEEVLIEVAGTTNQPRSFVLAVSLDARRSAIWETNLALVIRSISGSSPFPMEESRPGWTVRCGNGSSCFVLTRSNAWTLFGAADDLSQFDQLSQRLLQPAGILTVDPASNVWLSATADLPRLLTKPALLRQLPRLHLQVFGQNGRTRTEAQMQFTEPLESTIPSWDIPTCVIDQPCSSITVCRGFPQVLLSAESWRGLHVGAPPDQVIAWALQGQYMMTYLISKVPNADETVSLVSNLVMQSQSAWFASNDLGGFRALQPSGGIEWSGLPYMWPFLRTLETNKQTFVLGGTWTWADPVDPVSSNFFDKALGPRGVVYYDWERTDQRIPQWLYMSQFVRHVCNQPQLPFKSAALLWLKAVSPVMTDAITRIEVTGPNILSFLRTSDVSFTAIELHLLADWLESPTFPTGLGTFVAPPREPPPEETSGAGTNSPPSE